MQATDDGTVLTGEVVGDIVDGQRKLELLETIACNDGIPLDQVSCPRNEANRRRSRLAMVRTIF